MLALPSVVLGVGILFSGCDKTPETPKKQVGQVETAQPAKPVVSERPTKPVVSDETTAFLKEIGACEDLFRLHEMKEEYEQGEAQSGKVTLALKEKWHALVAECEPKEIITDHVDLLAFSMRSSDDGECRGWWLFRTKKAMDKDYTMQLLGYVDKSHLPRIPQRFRDWGYTYQPWNLDPHPPTSSWKAGELIVIGEALDEIQPIPYNPLFRFFFPELDDKGTPIRQVMQTWGIPLGWHACLPEESSTE